MPQLTDKAGDPLRRKIEAMPEATRRQEIRIVNEMTEFELDRANNIARLKEMEEHLIGNRPWQTPDAATTATVTTISAGAATTTSPSSLSPPSLLSPPPPANVQASSAPGERPDEAGSYPASSPTPSNTRHSPSLFPSTQNGGPQDPASEADPDQPAPLLSSVNEASLDDLETEMDAPATPSPDTPTHSRDISVTHFPDAEDALSVDKQGWPEWLDDHFTRFEGENAPEGLTGEWQALLKEWVLFERVQGFEQKVRVLLVHCSLSDH